MAVHARVFSVLSFKAKWNSLSHLYRYCSLNLQLQKWFPERGALITPSPGLALDSGEPTTVQCSALLCLTCQLPSSTIFFSTTNQRYLLVLTQPDGGAAVSYVQLSLTVSFVVLRWLGRHDQNCAFRTAGLRKVPEWPSVSYRAGNARL